MSATLPTFALSPKRPAKRNRWWLLPAGLVLLAGLLWAAPHIVAATKLRDWVVARLFPQVDGVFASSSASFDWFSPVVLHDVQIIDRNGKTVLRIGKIRSQKTLLSLILDPDQAGTFQIDHADLQLHVTGKEFNVEKVLPSYFGKANAPRSGSGSGQSGALSFAMDILDSSISQHDAETDRQVKIEMVHGKVNLAANSAEPLSVELHGTVVETAEGKSPTPAGQIDAVFRWLTEEQGRGEFTIKTDGMTLAAVNPLLRRAGIDAELAGSVHGNCVYRWGRKAGAEFSEIDANIASDAVVMSGPWLSDDRIRLQRVALPCRLEMVGSRVKIDEANLTADLGRAAIAGTLDLNDDLATWLNQPGCTVFADVDLAALANQLPNTLRLQPGTQLTSGRARLNCTSQKNADGAVWEGNFTTTPLHGVRNGQPVDWPESMNLVFRARKNADGLPQIDSLRGESKFLNIEGSGNSDDLRVRLDVDLEKLAEPIGQFVDLSAWQLRGQGWASLSIHAEENNLYLLGTTGNFKNVHLFGVQDPTLDWQADGRWSAGKLHVNTASLRTSVAEIEGTDLDIARNSGALPIVSGKANIRGEISRIRRWLADKQSIATPISGTLLAYVDLPKGDTPAGTVDIHLSDVVVGNPKSPTWREPHMRIWTQLRLPQQDSLVIDRVYFEMQGLACDAKGKIDELRTSRILDLNGLMKYDFEKLEPALRAYLGAEARLSGKDKHVFQIAGPLTPGLTHLGGLTGRAELGWQHVHAHGGDFGPAALKLRLQDGWVRAEPIHTSLNNGKLHMQPAVRLEPAPMELHLRPGIMIEKAMITPEMSKGMLGYAVPVLAGVAKIDGEVTLVIDDARLPLDDARRSEMHGKLTVHNARFGATKMVQELGAAFKAAPPSVQIKECTVPVKMIDGKVYHEGLEFVAADVAVRTSGWVAVDGNMNLLAEMAVPERWLSKLSPTLSKQTIKLPIRGTLGSPQIDEVALRSAINQFTRDAAGKLLQRELEQGLKKLFQR